MKDIIQRPIHRVFRRLLYKNESRSRSGQVFLSIGEALYQGVLVVDGGVVVSDGGVAVVDRHDAVPPNRRVVIDDNKAVVDGDKIISE